MNAHTRHATASDTADRPSAAMLVVAWLFLVTLAVVGRAWQPGLNITPMAAVALAAGVIFPSTLLAASVPVAAIALGNLFLPVHDHLLMAVVIFAGFTWPVLLGRFGLLGRVGSDTRWPNVVGGALASTIVFPLSDCAHWLLTDMYPKSAEGLLACLAAGLPFYRWVPVGNVAWSLGVFGILAGMVAAGDALAARGLTATSVARDTRLTGGPQA